MEHFKIRSDYCNGKFNPRSFWSTLFPTDALSVHVLAEELDEALVTVGLVVVILERSLVELLQAERANEMLLMKFLAHRANASTGDGFLASSAEGASLGVIVCLAVGQTIQLEEATVCEGSHTLATHEALGVPLLVQR